MSEIIRKPVKYKSAKNLLKAARKLLENGPWGREQYLNPRTGEFCAVGALYIARMGLAKNDEYHWIEELRHSDIVDEAINSLDNITRKKYKTSLISFNDTKTTTKENVLEVFDLAIKNSV